MELSGDEKGLAELKKLSKDNKDFLRFLLSEAQTNADASASFKGEDGTEYILKVNTVKQTIEVQPASTD